MDKAVIDKRGFRLGVGIIIVNQRGKLLWARRIGNPDAWQFPQGGLLSNETPHEAAMRELSEEIGLKPDDIVYLGETRHWLSYRLPKQFRRYDDKPLCIGQRQKWFLLQLKEDDDSRISLNHSQQPEFDRWCWVDYWYPLEHVIEFKRGVYRKVLKEFARLMR